MAKETKKAGKKCSRILFPEAEEGRPMTSKQAEEVDKIAREMAEVKIPKKKKDGGGDGSRSKEGTSKKRVPKENAVKYVIPKKVRAPDEEIVARGETGNPSTRGGRGSRRGACFICTMEGHYARDCPKSRNAIVRGRERGRGRGVSRVRKKEV